MTGAMLMGALPPRVSGFRRGVAMLNTCTLPCVGGKSVSVGARCWSVISFSKFSTACLTTSFIGTTSTTSEKAATTDVTNNSATDGAAVSSATLR